MVAIVKVLRRMRAAYQR